MALFALWLFGAFLLACVTLGRVLFSQPMPELWLTGGGVILCYLLGLLPGARRLTPSFLASCGLDLVQGTVPVQEAFPALLLTAALSALLLLGSILIFRKKQL